MIRQLLIAVTLLISISLPAQTNDHKPAQYNVSGILWQEQSGEYKALCYQAFNLARLRLEEILRTNKDSMPLAVITDVDETVLDNSPEAAKDILNGRTYSDSARQWLCPGIIYPKFPGTIIVSTSVQNIFCSAGAVVKHRFIHIGNNGQRHTVFIGPQNFLQP